MRLAFFVPSLRGGGAERVTLTLAREAADRGYQVDLVLTRREGPYEADVSPKVRVIDFAMPRVSYCLPRLAGYLRRERPTGLLAVMPHCGIIALAARRLARATTTRVAVTLRSTLSEDARQGSTLRARAIPWLTKLSLAQADAVIVASRGAAADLVRTIRFPRERIDVIYNPVLRPELQRQAQQPLDDTWLTPGAPPVFLSAGRLVKSKDFATLVRAFARIRARQDARLMILGEGPERAELEKLVQSLDLQRDVRLPGFVANSYAYMARAAAFVLASRYEGLPNVLIESMCCGTPVISTDCPHGPREILKGGMYGQLVPVADVDALVRSMRLVLECKQPRVSENILRPYELRTVADQYFRLLTSD